METQRHLFQLPETISYFNCAYMSPLMKSVEEAGIKGIIRKRNPVGIQPIDFFKDADTLRKNAAKLLNAQPSQIAIIPSASYGLSSAIQNLPKNNGDTAIVVSEEFPSGYNTIKKWCERNGKKLQTIQAPREKFKKGELWNEKILDSINFDTAVVVLSSVHWTDGTRFDLRAIGDKCKQSDALLVVDGTQSVGAVPIDVAALNIDVLVCAAYKWLLGPYSIGIAYFGSRFDEGNPLEESWLNRTNALNFSGLTDYTDDYGLGAGKYNVGEFSNFILVPMLNAAIEQILKWKVEEIAAYCEQLTLPLVNFLINGGFYLEEKEFRSSHLFGFSLPDEINKEKFLETLKANHIYISLRGHSVRVSPHLYNNMGDVEKFVGVLAEFQRANP